MLIGFDYAIEKYNLFNIADPYLLQVKKNHKRKTYNTL